MKKNILILSNTLSGLHRFRREVIEAFLDKGYGVIICTPEAEIKDFFINMGCLFVPISFERKSKNPFELFTILSSYCKIIKEYSPDLILTYTIKPNIYGGIASRLYKKPLIANITGLGTALEKNGWMQKMLVLLLKLGLKNASAIFFQNRENLKFFQDHHISNSNHILIPGSGVNLTYHSQQEYPKESPLRFVFISRIRKEKGIDQYLEAAKIIKAEHENVEFHVVGPCEDNYKDLLRDLQNKNIIIFHGAVTDVRPVLANIHCTIHPSYYPEGMSNVLLESCANGRPIITTDRSGCREIVEDGITGYIVKQRNVDELVDRIRKFINLSYKEKREMGMAARNKVEKEFSRDIVVNAYLKEVQSI